LGDVPPGQYVRALFLHVVPPVLSIFSRAPRSSFEYLYAHKKTPIGIRWNSNRWIL